MSRLALVLHSHMPYVEGFDTWPFGEEWLWEATASVYLPLLDRLESAQAPITVGVTPVLADQLEAMRDGEPGERFLSFLRDVRTAVHDEDERGLRDTGFPDLADEVRRALDAGAKLVGINARNLKTLEVDPRTFERLAPLIHDRVVRVAESAVRGPHDVIELAQAGADVVLVGEALVTGRDPRRGVADLVAAGAHPAVHRL